MMRKDLMAGGNPSQHLVGNCLAVLTGCMLALYEVSLARTESLLAKCGINASDWFHSLAVAVFVGLVSLVVAPVIVAILCFAFPTTFVLHESFVLPPASTIPALVANAFFSNAFNVLLILGVALTSPTDVAVGCALESPIAMVVDVFFRSVTLSFEQIGGAALVIGFFLWLSFEASAAHSKLSNAAMRDGNDEHVEMEQQSDPNVPPKTEETSVYDDTV
eukprot:PhM_4_TR668/c0_g1_i1/m.22376